MRELPYLTTTLPKHTGPCFSCHNPQFDESYTVKRRIGIVIPKSVACPESLCPYERIDPESASFEELIAFIGSSEIVFATAIHVLYWALLLQVKAVYLPHRVLVDTSVQIDCYTVYKVTDDIDKDIEKCNTYPSILQECREKSKVNCSVM